MINIEWPPPKCLIVAELGATAAGDLDWARHLIDEACAAGADAIKTQCFTPEDMTLPGVHRCGPGPWNGRDLFELYRECAMPLEWHHVLKQTANDLGLAYFSTPFQPWHVDFLEGLRVPAYKVASFEVDHVPLLERIAATGKPCMYSLGTATEADTEAWFDAGLTERRDWLAMHCVSQYPAAANAYPLDDMAWDHGCASRYYGLSDHTLGHTVAVAAAALGARVIEKHFTTDRTLGGPDAVFSAEPHEFRAMVDAVRTVEAALEPSPEPEPSPYRRGLWVTRDVTAGEAITEAVAILRPRAELTPVDWADVKDGRFARDMKRGEMLRKEDVA